MSMIARLRLSLQRFECYLQRWTATHFYDQSHQDFALDLHEVSENMSTDCETKSSLLEEIFNPTLYAVPKHRRSRERRLQRKFGNHIMQRFVQIKKNLVMCLECGQWHERRTICGNCYERAKEETEEMKKELGEEMQYTPDQKEVAFLYDGEESQTFEGKHIVEMKKPRPKWFSDALMTKVKTSNN